MGGTPATADRHRTPTSDRSPTSDRTPTSPAGVSTAPASGRPAAPDRSAPPDRTTPLPGAAPTAPASATAPAPTATPPGRAPAGAATPPAPAASAPAAPPAAAPPGAVSEPRVGPPAPGTAGPSASQATTAPTSQTAHPPISPAAAARTAQSGAPTAPTGTRITPAGSPAAPTGSATAPTGSATAPTGSPATPAGTPTAPSGLAGAGAATRGPLSAGSEGGGGRTSAPGPDAGRPAAVGRAESGKVSGAVSVGERGAKSGSVAEGRVDVPDFGRIAGARVAALSVPVAGIVRVVRRKNVIGAETTGSIPVHLLFRDEPEGGAPGANGDDGGPDTVAMAAPAKIGKAAIPAPAKTQQTQQTQQTQAAHRQKPGNGSAKARPAPTADPELVERPGAVLPGWVGVVGGALALAGCAAVVWWAGAVPAEAARMLRLPARPYQGIHLGQWALLALGVVAALFAVGGLGRGRVGYAWVLTLFGDYRGTVRRTGLVWVSPLLLRRRVDVRLRHWRSEPLPAVDAKGTALDVVVLVVWRVRDTVRAALGVDGHEEYLREQVEAAMARVLSQLPADAFHEDAPTLRDAEAVGEALTRMLSAECAPVGVDVFSAQPTRIEYAPEVAAAMQRRRIAAIDAKHRDSVLTSVVDAVDDVVHRLTSRGLVELDDYERKALVKDLTVAFYTGRTAPVEGA
ncbi:SPFH domain-containing protein [Streptomyces sp. NPDC015130]|uniref:SPFH domain-containing protein n=1 Tax=Streptomyces sp. NPDC015130 TaxID=3364940 RepID=UPI0036FC4208